MDTGTPTPPTPSPATPPADGAAMQAVQPVLVPEVKQVSPAVPAPAEPAITAPTVSGTDASTAQPVSPQVVPAPVTESATPGAAQESSVPVEVTAAPSATLPSDPVPTPDVTKQTTDSGKKKVLIVEDERPLAHALELKLSHEGYDPTVALTGSEGLQKALSGDYAVVLLDLIMPELDGFSLLEQLQQKGITSPVIVLSNLGQEEDKAKAKSLGALDYFVKANTPILEIVKRMKSAMT